jgi:hypothetical protein
MRTSGSGRQQTCDGERCLLETVRNVQADVGVHRHPRAESIIRADDVQHAGRQHRTHQLAQPQRQSTGLG